MSRHPAAERPSPTPRETSDRADGARPTARIPLRVAGRPAETTGPVGQRDAAPARERTHPSALRLFIGWLGSLVLLAAVGLALAVAVVPAAVGGSALTVRSPTMVPTYPVGTLVVIRPRPAEGIRIGDVVAFTDRDPASGAARTVTHRVVGIDPGPRFRTKGDANEAPDAEPVTAAEVRGVAWYSLPVVGGWGNLVRSGPGVLVTGGAVLLIVALMLLAPRRGR